MKVRGILFSGSMVRAILDGRKTQTRRVVKPQPELNGTIHHDTPAWWWPTKRSEAGYVHTDWTSLERIMLSDCPYGVPGDRLWVRETIEFRSHNDNFYYCADGKGVGTKIYTRILERGLPRSNKLSSIHMPRWASRITLEIVGVKVEKLQSISEEDAKAEGVTPKGCTHPDCYPGSCASSRYKPEFAILWDSINGKTHPWASNPWVWVIESRRLAK